MQTKYFKEGELVICHSLGEKTPGEFRAIVVGISAKYPGGCIYILKTIDVFFTVDEYNYSCYTMPSACVRKA